MDITSHGVVALVRNSAGRFLLLEDSRESMRGYWAPPHGRCESFDISEKAGLIRETEEETGLRVSPRKKLFTQKADTKVKTVSFWSVDLVGGEFKIDDNETSNFGWFTVEEALGLKLYPGTQIFFEKIRSGELKLT